MNSERIVPDPVAAIIANAVLMTAGPTWPSHEPPPSRGRVTAALSRFADWLGKSAETAERRRRDAYLARATDAVDLERRVRALERAAIAESRGW